MPDKRFDPAEAQLFAFAALRALDGAGFDVVPKKESPMPTGPEGEKRPADVLSKRRFKPFH